MNYVADRPTMAKRKGRPAKPSGEGVAVRLDSDLVSKARYLCAQSGESMTDYLSAILRPKVEKDFRQAAKPLLDANEDKS
jgi:hypothetical protein